MISLKKHVPALILALLLSLPSNTASQSFTRVTVGDIVTESGWSEGGNWVDINGDGFLDLFVGNNPRSITTNFLYLNNGDGTFTRVLNDTIVRDPVMTESASWGDIDNDGDWDVLTADGGFDIARPNNLYLNNGDLSFTKVVIGAIVTEASLSSAATLIDYDNDGFLDAYIANFQSTDFLYHNNGDGTFAKVFGSPVTAVSSSSFGAAWCDYDGDGDPDLYVCNSSGVNYLFRNDNNGDFVRILDAGPAVTDANNSIGCSWGDYDNDGDFDLYVGNFGANDNLYRNTGMGTFERALGGPIVTSGGRAEGSAWADYDNDGDLDLIVGNGGASFDFDFLFRNDGGTFTRIFGTDFTSVSRPTAGLCVADYDNDGQLDLFVTCFQNGAANLLYHNDGNSNNWLNVQLTGTLSNRSAIGTIVKAKATINGVPTWQMRQIAGQSGYNSENSFRAHFGLADAATVDSLRIEWPSGIVQVMENVSAGQFLQIAEDGIRFQADTIFGLAPRTIQFSPLTEKTLLSTLWKFGDGDTSNMESPAHLYTDPGQFTVELTAQTTSGEFTAVKEQYILLYSDTLDAQDASATGGNTVAIDVTLTNFIPVRRIVLPFTWSGELGLAFDSVTVTGRTSAMTITNLLIDPFNPRKVFQLSDGVIEPGSGPALTLHFTVPSGGTSASDTIRIQKVNSFDPTLSSTYGDYTPASLAGIISRECCQTPGDANNDGTVNIADVTFLIARIFAAGPAPACNDEADANGNNTVNIADVTFLIARIFAGGSAPVCGNTGS